MSAYWIALYRQIDDPEKVAAYARLAAPAIAEAGGEFLVRGLPSACYEAGQMERSVVIRFASVESAEAAHASPAYQAALEALGDGAVRDMRVVEGV
ncbi:MAG: DUF1330 domain-containing protein [Aeromicrobium sp.]|uniref:DUF1330 domain-containing protein n=1 Tax=Aeromicrobium sp. TaxID=1871063 RepID=UPI0039E6B8E0